MGRVLPEPGNFDWMMDCHKDEEMFIVGTGQSLKGFDFSRLGGKLVMAINLAGKYVQHKYCVFLDRDMPGMLGDFDPKVMYISGPTTRLKPGGNICKVRTLSKPSLNPRQGLFGSRTTGLLAINCALVMGCARIYLLGYDCNDTGSVHFFDSKKVPGYFKGGGVRYTSMAGEFEKFRPWASRITNLSPISLIKTFGKADVDKVLA